MLLIFAALAVFIAVPLLVLAYSLVLKVLRGMRWLLVLAFTGKRPQKKAPALTYVARPYRRDYSYIPDDTPSPLNPYFVDVLDAEAAGWSFEYGGYVR